MASAAAATSSTQPWVSAGTRASSPHPQRCAWRRPLGRQPDSKPGLVDPVDLDVLALVETHDVDVHRRRGKQGQGQVAQAVAHGHGGQLSGRDHVDPAR